jgi:hypothetical protein
MNTSFGLSTPGAILSEVAPPAARPTGRETRGCGKPKPQSSGCSVVHKGPTEQPFPHDGKRARTGSIMTTPIVTEIRRNGNPVGAAVQVRRDRITAGSVAGQPAPMEARQHARRAVRKSR